VIRVAGKTLAVCALAGSVACATNLEPTGIEYTAYTASLAASKPGGDVQFGTSVDDAVYGIVVGKLGVALVGTTAGAFAGQSNAGGRDAFVRVLDKNGAIVWTREFGTTADDGAFGVAMDRSGIYIGGTTSGALDGTANLGASDGYVRMVDANGSLVWKTRLASAGADSVFGLAVDRDAVYVTGELRGPLEGSTVGNADGYVVKLDARTGEILWMTRFAGTSGGDDGARAVVVDGDAVFVAATYDGGTSGGGPGAQDAYIAKLDAITGAFTWLSTVATTQKDVGMDVTLTGGTVFLVGTSGDHSFAAAFTALTGAMQWKTTLATAGTDVATTADANQSRLHVGGWTTGAFPGMSNTGTSDVFHATLDVTTGAVQAVDQLGTAGQDAAFGSFLDGKVWHLVGTTGGNLAGTSTGGMDAWWVQLGDR
jgi:outer membrane protein assembly factor BamB